MEIAIVKQLNKFYKRCRIFCWCLEYLRFFQTVSNNADNFHQVYQSFRGDTNQTLSEYSYMNTEFDNYLQQQHLISCQIVINENPRKRPRAPPISAKGRQTAKISAFFRNSYKLG